MRKLENKKLDEIGKKLLTADVVPAREIENVVSNPALFNSVLARIDSELLQEAPARRSLMRPLVASGSTLALIAVAVFSFVTFRSNPAEVVKRPLPTTPVASEQKHSSVPDTVGDSSLRTIPPVGRVESERVVERVSSVRPVRPRQPAAQQARYEENFYAISYAGDPNETERGGRIVRVEIPRSTLFAMGVNVPLENESATVKADLLIGNDGVTRGIRVVE